MLGCTSPPIHGGSVFESAWEIGQASAEVSDMLTPGFRIIKDEGKDKYNMLLNIRTNILGHRLERSEVRTPQPPLHRDIDPLTLDTPSDRALATRLRAPWKGRPPIALPDLLRALHSRAYERSFPRAAFTCSSYVGLSHHSSTLVVAFFCTHDPLEFPEK